MTHQNKNKFFGGTRQLLSAGLLLLGSLAVAGAQAQVATDPYSYSRTSAFDYDDTTGLLKSETVEPNNPNLCVTTSYQYDAYGNRATATTANCANASGRAVFSSRTRGSTYSAESVTVSGTTVPVPAGAFPTVVTNALNKSETKAFDPRFGTVTSLTGPNGLTTTWEIDDFGRVVREKRADGTSTVTAYCFLGSVDTSSNSDKCSGLSTADAPTDAVSFVYSEPHDANDVKNGPFTRVYVDRAGRKLRTVTEAFDGAAQAGGNSRLIVQDTDYNAQGVAIVTTQPYFFDSKSSLSGGSIGYGKTRTDYDVLGRPTTVYVADGQGSQASVPFGSRDSAQATITTISYTGLTTTTVNDKGQSRTEEKNVDGKVVRVTDAYGAQVAYQHDAFGNLIATKDALQNTTTVTYDIRGRKVSLTDPDSGTTQYDYDALGQLVWQQTANQAAANQATTLSYDFLGRLTQLVEPEYTSSWTYDKYADGSTCAMGVGKLCETSTTNGINKKIVFDNLGRPINTRTNVTNGPSFATAVSYDSVNGRLASQTWPTGLAVSYNYTAKGFLNSVTLAQAATINPLPATAGGAPGPSATLAAGSVLWQAQTYNAWGKAEKFIYGNNVVSNASFDPQTGRVLGQTAGAGTATNVMSYSYAYDSLSHLTRRTDDNGDGTTGAVTDSFDYDSLGRLQSYTVSAPSVPNLARTVSLQYNALGMLLYKSDVGAYTYLAQGGAHPHALQSVAGAFSASYAYDANGNVKSANNGGWRSVAYTSFNLPDSQNGVQGTGGTQYLWQYDENHQRIKESRTNGSGTRTTWELHPDNVGGLAFESEQSGSTTSNRHYISAGGQIVGVLVSTGALPNLAVGQTAPPAVTSLALVKVEYWHQDHLGSLATTTDHAGTVTARYSYDPFGKRRYTNGNYDANGKLVIDWSTGTNNGDDRGWTGHEHLDDVGIVHMNGRLFDPLLGRFMQADPFVQDAGNLQNFNRYGYCYNNPMTCTDPSGLLFGGMFSVPVVDNLWNHHIKPYAPMIASIAISMYLGPGGAGALFNGFEGAGLANAAVAGFVSGSVASGNLKGGLQGMATSMMFYGAGRAFEVDNYMDAAGKITNPGLFAGAIAAHGVVGCVSNVMSGAKCGPGALSAAFSKATLPVTGPLGNGHMLAGTVVSSIVGGTGSVLGGGKFANGAVTGAFSYLYNYCSGDGNCTSKLEKALWDWMPGYRLGTCINDGNCTFGEWSHAVGKTAIDILGGAELKSAKLATEWEAIGSTGVVGENALKALGGESQAYFPTTMGGRYVDQLVNGIAHESKVGYASLTADIRTQIAKDVELIQTREINGATWHFFKSPVTGLGGPSKPLLDELRKNGISVIQH